MKRVPEPELMDAPDQARAYAEADFAEPNTAFVALLGARFPDLPRRATVVDLGCGPADITVRMAEQYGGWTIDAVDGSPAMLAFARMAVADRNLGGRVRLVEGRLPEVALPRDRYDLVVSNSLLHHLPEPAVFWQTVRRLAGPGSRVLVMDLFRPVNEGEARRLVRTYAADEAEILQRDFYLSLCAAWRPEEVQAQVAAAGLEALRVETVSDRHLVVAGRL